MDNETWLVGSEATKYFNVNVLPVKNEIVAYTSSYFDKYKNTPKNIINTQDKGTKNTLEEEKQQILNDLEKICII